MCSDKDCENCEYYCEYNQDIDLSNCEWCSLAECYVDKEDCTNRGCENCSYYLDS